KHHEGAFLSDLREHSGQFTLVLFAKAVARIAREVSGLAQRIVWRIEVEEIFRSRKINDPPKVAQLDFDTLQSCVRCAQHVFVKHPRFCVASDWDIELAFAIHAIEPVVTGAVQIDRARRSFYVAKLNLLPVEISDAVEVFLIVSFLVNL